MNHSLAPSATRLNIKQDFADAGDELPMPMMWEDVCIEVFKVHDPSPRAYVLGLPAAVSLLDQSKCPSYHTLKVAQQGVDCKERIQHAHKVQHAITSRMQAVDPRICTAKLVQAFIACPSIHDGTCGAAKTSNEQMKVLMQQGPEPVEKSSFVLM